MTEPLVSPQWLATHASDVCVLDIRSAVDGGGAAAYEQAHVRLDAGRASVDALVEQLVDWLQA